MDIAAFNSLSRPGSPNTCLVAPEGVCANAVPDKTSERYLDEPKALFALILDIVEAETRWTVTAQDADEGTISFIATSKLMRYKDDVSILVLPARGEESGSELAIYSRSRVGYSDMGANRKRVLGLLKRLKDRQKQV